MKKLYKVGIYCRLSVDDASNSAKAKNYIPADGFISGDIVFRLGGVGGVVHAQPAIDADLI